MRLWALYGVGQQVIGAIVQRSAAPDLVTAQLPPRVAWLAVVTTAQLGESTMRETLDGRRFSVRPIVGEQLQEWAGFETEAAALSHLEALKAINLAAGWVEHALDPINDPD